MRRAVCGAFRHSIEYPLQAGTVAADQQMNVQHGEAYEKAGDNGKLGVDGVLLEAFQLAEATPESEHPDEYHEAGRNRCLGYLVLEVEEMQQKRGHQFKVKGDSDDAGQCEDYPCRAFQPSNQLFPAVARLIRVADIFDVTDVVSHRTAYSVCGCNDAEHRDE